MTIARGLAAITLIAAAGAPASADELRATRGQSLDEISHTVSVRISDGIATYTVQRQFQNRGKLADEARLAIDLPAGAAATGLRIRASGKWHTGELLDSALAADRYRELTGAGVYDPKDPALLFWVSPSELFLQIFPVAPGGVSTVEYTLTVPTRYAAGRYWLAYPRVDRTADRTAAATAARPRWARKLVDPVVTVQPGWMPAGGGLVVDGKPARPGQPVALAARAREAWQPAAPARAADDAETGDDPAAASRPDADPDAELPYAASAIVVPPSPRGELRYTRAKLRVELQHPSVTELSLALVTPAGALVPVADGGDRGGPNELAERSSLEVQLPEPTPAAGRWRLLVRSRATGDTGALLGWSLAFGERTFASADPPAFIPDGDDGPRMAIFSVEPPAAATWTGRLGRVVASTDHAFSRLELDAAPRLSAAPKRAQVVFVLDASYSVGADLLDAQLAIVRAYLAHVPDAELEVIAVRRTARRLFGRFVPAALAPRLLDAAVRGGALALGNGSALDEGARLAAQLLAGRPGPQRLVLATDELLRGSFSEAAVRAALAPLAPSAVVHVVVPAAGYGERPILARDDGASLAGLATAHHGILARISGLSPNEKGPELLPVVLELVRPTRIDGLAIAGKSPLSLGDTLREGEGVRLFDSDLTAATAPSSLSLTGKLWSDPVRLDLTASPAFSTATAAFVFSADRFGHLSEAEQRTVALAGRAVSPVTSYLAIEPGVRPSKIGLEDAIGLGGIGTLGVGRYGTVSRCGGVQVTTSTDLASLIPTAACVRKHAPGGPWSVKLQLELTRDEIVDIDVLDGTDPLAACLAEAAWTVRVPMGFVHEHDSRVVVLSGP